MPKLTIDIITHPRGAHRAIVSEYESAQWSTGDKGITLTETFVTERDVHEQFAELEEMISQAKAQALKIVSKRLRSFAPQTCGVTEASFSDREEATSSVA